MSSNSSHPSRTGTQGHATDKTIAYLRQLIASAPGHVDAHRQLASALESRHDLDEAAAVTSSGLAVAPQDPVLNMLAAKLERRQGEHSRAAERLEKIIPQVKDDVAGQSVLTEYGILLDLDDRPADAMAAFERANRIAAQSWNKDNPGPNAALAALEHQLAVIDPSWAMQWQKHACPDGDRHDPVFLIGFPRSGTTLLDQVLSAHQGFQVMEEYPVVAAVENELVKAGCTAPEDWPRLPEALVKQARQSYWIKVASVQDISSERLFVDKMPLATRRLPLIHRLFPEAKILFVQRHPLDVCLSCFMQAFQPNPAMANFFSLHATARFFAATMDLWLRCTELLPIDYHVVKYEALVADLEGETRRLTDFIGIDWNPEMLNYHTHARQRSGLKTPSYSQVTRPIYKTSRYRWKRYAPMLEEIKGMLAPYISTFGYDGTP